MDIKQLHKDFENCPCGKEHKCPIDKVLIGKNVLGELDEICKDYKSILLVCDENTDKACAGKVFDILSRKISKKLVLEKTATSLFQMKKKSKK